MESSVNSYLSIILQPRFAQCTPAKGKDRQHSAYIRYSVVGPGRGDVTIEQLCARFTTVCFARQLST